MVPIHWWMKQWLPFYEESIFCCWAKYRFFWWFFLFLGTFRDDFPWTESDFLSYIYNNEYSDQFYFFVTINPLLLRRLSLPYVFVIILDLVLLEIEIASFWLSTLFELLESLNWSKEGIVKKLFIGVSFKLSICGTSIIADDLGGFILLYLGGWIIFGVFVENRGLPSNEGLRAFCWGFWIVLNLWGLNCDGL